jgi:hypothetical protein
MKIKMGFHKVTPKVDDHILQILDTTGAKVRKFLYELAEGTKDYRSLHNLTEQVEHQYHGRFVIELIQNAHDALWTSDNSTERPARIVLAIRSDGPFGSLYVANDGRPFSHSNFESLSQLGNSDKDPQESIGNKGIGFRSVLEISKEPAIYSRLSPDSTIFDGYCFELSPSVIQGLKDPILALVLGASDALPLWNGQPLVDWESKLIDKLRLTVGRQSKALKMALPQWIEQELAYLSPYLLPVPLSEDSKSKTVVEFEEAGFASLIRLPFRSVAAAELARKHLQVLDAGSLLFLDRISSLTVDAGDQNPIVYSRRQKTRSDTKHNGRDVLISTNSKPPVARYLLWDRKLVVGKFPEFAQAALHQLPGKWPQLREAVVSIGVRVDDFPERGSLSIFLPTLLGSGCSAHVNAPFFGDMSRTHIDFGNTDNQEASAGAVYNIFLLLETARLALSVIGQELAGRGLEEARAIVDLLAPSGTDYAASSRWHTLTGIAAKALGADITMSAWFLSDHGWKTLRETYLLPSSGTPSILTRPILRKHARFSAYVEGLESRIELIECLSSKLDVGAYPPRDALADTVESIAVEFHKQPDPDWNKFWADVDHLFDGDFGALMGKQVLPGNDGQLHASGDGCTVFFVPRQGPSDDEEVENEGDVKEIPQSLSPFVAFLSEGLHVYEEKNGRPHETRIRKLLIDSKLVRRFRREDIVNDVLLARIPSLPVSLTSEDALLCRDISLWGLRLMAHLIDRGKGERSFRLLKALPAPCQGGWYPLAETAFGLGWLGMRGEIAQNYLSRVNTRETRATRDRLLLPPSHEAWTGSGMLHLDLLQLVGVFDGLRLTAVDPNSWSSRFKGYKGYFTLPENPPSGWSKNDWGEYSKVARDESRPTYNEGTYEIQRVYALPGLDKYLSFDNDTRLALMEAILGSMANWEEGWESLWIHRVEGNKDSFSLTSPLAWILRRSPWLGLRDGGVLEWCRPADRWHVPAFELARGKRWQFAHLRPLPGDLANRLDIQPRLANAIRQLGLPRFDPEIKSASTRLLDALTDAVERDEVPHWDVFLGQVRSAWRGFEPSTNSVFPKKLLVQRGGSRLVVANPDNDQPVYLPDSTKSFLASLKHFELPVIAIEPDDAKRLADRFISSYSEGLLRASELQPVPLVNGEHWSISTTDRLRDNTELEWFIPVILTIAACYGPQAQGTTTKVFRKHIEVFREAKLCIVGRIETGLFRGDKLVVPPLPMPALWQADSQTLLLSNGWKTETSSLSEAFASILDREDLEVPIKLVLGITGWDPIQTDIIRALEQLKLSEAHWRDVREHWRGDITQIIEMLIPLLALLRPEVNIGPFIELDTEDAVVEFLIA